MRTWLAGRPSAWPGPPGPTKAPADRPAAPDRRGSPSRWRARGVAVGRRFGRPGVRVAEAARGGGRVGTAARHGRGSPALADAVVGGGTGRVGGDRGRRWTRDRIGRHVAARRRSGLCAPPAAPAWRHRERRQRRVAFAVAVAGSVAAPAVAGGTAEGSGAGTLAVWSPSPAPRLAATGAVGGGGVTGDATARPPGPPWTAPERPLRSGPKRACRHRARTAAPPRRRARAHRPGRGRFSSCRSSRLRPRAPRPAARRRPPAAAPGASAPPASRTAPGARLARRTAAAARSRAARPAIATGRRRRACGPPSASARAVAARRCHGGIERGWRRARRRHLRRRTDAGGSGLTRGRHARRRQVGGNVRGLDLGRVGRGLDLGTMARAGRLRRRMRRGRRHAGQGDVRRDRDAGPAARRHGGIAVEHRAQLFAVLRPLVRADRQHPPDRLEETRRDAGNDAALNLVGVVLDRARRRRRRRRAVQQVVDDGAESIEIGPRPLAQLRHFRVLLDRRVARLEDGGQRLRAVADDATRRAEVEQHRRAVVRQQDVVGRDVAVVDAFAVQQLERGEDRRDDAADPGLVGRVGHAPAGIAQGDALEVGHHHVGGGVVFPETVDLDQRRMVEAGEQPRFVDERAQADRVGLGEGARADRDLRPRAARRQRGRHVFLERHLALERMVVGKVDDAEAADAENPQDLELAEAGAGRQRVVVGTGRGGRGRSGVGRKGAHRRRRPMRPGQCASLPQGRQRSPPSGRGPGSAVSVTAASSVRQ